MIKIYFDNELIDADDYLEINNEYNIFGDTFYLGSVASNTFTITLPLNCYNNFPEVVTIYEDDIIIATLNVDSYEINDDDTIKFNLVDNMLKFDFNYDANELIEQLNQVANSDTKVIPTTFQILQDICNKANVELGINEFLNDDIYVNYYDNTITAREYISFIAELNGGYAQIGRDGKLYLKRFDTIPTEINLEECESIKIYEHNVIERVVYDSGVDIYDTHMNDENKNDLNTLYLNPQNVFITNKDIFDNIVSVILNFSFYALEVSNSPVVNVLAGDLINFISEDVSYVTIAGYNHSYSGNFIGGYKQEATLKKQEETQSVGISESIKSLKVIVDRNKNEIIQQVNLIDDISGLYKEVKDTLTSTERRIDVIGTNIDKNTGEVREVKTITGFSFDAIGLHIKNNDTKFNTEITNTGTFYKDDNVIVASTTKDGFNATKIQNQSTYEYGFDNSNYLFVDELIEINNEKAIATFYSGGD